MARLGIENAPLLELYNTTPMKGHDFRCYYGRALAQKVFTVYKDDFLRYGYRFDIG
jgi:hypothetical protein